METSDGCQLLTAVNLKSAMNRQAVANVVGYYARQVGIVYGNGNGKVGLKAGDKPSEENPAFTSGNDIFLNKKGDKINSKMDDYNNLKNVLVHEKDHKDKGEGFKETSNLEHAEVYLKQVSDPTFMKATENFQNGTIGSMVNYIRNAAAVDGAEDSDIRNLVDRTNKAIAPACYQINFSRTGMQRADVDVKVSKTE